MSKMERVIQISTKMAELRAELAQLEGELGGLISSDAAASKARAPTQHPRKRADSLPSKVLQAINSEPGHKFDAGELAAALEDKTEHVRAALSRLKRAKRIRKAGRGKYRASPPPDVNRSGSANGTGKEAHAMNS